MKHILQFVIASIFLISCSDDGISSSPGNLSGYISSPESGITVREDHTLCFIAEDIKDSGSLIWYSSQDGEIGKEERFFRKISPGNHLVSLYSDDILLDEIDVEVTELQYSPGESYTYQISGNSIDCHLPVGEYYPFLISKSVSSYDVVVQSPLDRARYRASDLCVDNDDFLEMKSTRMTGNKYTQFSSTTRSSGQFTVGDSRSFYLADTNSVTGEYHEVDCDLLYQSDLVNLWFDTTSPQDSAILSEFWNEISTHAVPRVMTLWPGWADLNGNGRVDVLLSHRINDEEKAIGFFNSGDFYSIIDNEHSNEMDIIYLADPCSDPDVFAYSRDSIAATFCHEFCHLVNYSRKTYFPAINGFQASREELFLDEGLAHLTESLCGYGETGGNLAFFSRYLEDTALYSLNGEDYNGSDDSVGKRGAVSAFLSYIFWSLGGLEWDAVSSDIVTDNGGMSFLHKLLSSDLTGWDNITFASNINADELFNEWVRYLNRNIVPFDPVNDPDTGQILNIYPFYGDLKINDNIYTLNGPERYSVEESITIIPYSAIWLESVELLTKIHIIISSSDYMSGLTAEFHMPLGE